MDLERQIAGPAPKRRKAKRNEFDEDEFVSGVVNKKQERYRCCGKTCLLKILESAIRTHEPLLSFHFSFEPAGARNRIYRAFVMTCYMQHVVSYGKCSAYRVPAIDHPLCQ